MSEQPDIRLYSIGHSVHSMERFLELLQQHDISLIADVRTYPSSERNPQFNQGSLTGALRRCGIGYSFMGAELGGRPLESELYDDRGFVLYGRLAETERFKRGLADLIGLAEAGRVAVMCSEEDPADCHRSLLVGRVLHSGGVTMMHIRGDGRLETETGPPGVQLSFLSHEDIRWKSARSVSPRSTQPSPSSP